MEEKKIVNILAEETWKIHFKKIFTVAKLNCEN